MGVRDIFECVWGNFPDFVRSTVENIRKFEQIEENWVFIPAIADTLPA